MAKPKIKPNKQRRLVMSNVDEEIYTYVTNTPPKSFYFLLVQALVKLGH